VDGEVLSMSTETSRTLLRLRRLIALLSPRRPGFPSRHTPCEFFDGKVALGQVLLRVLRLCCVTVIQSVLHTHFHTILVGRTNSEAWEPFKNNAFFFLPGNLVALNRKYFNFVV